VRSLNLRGDFAAFDGGTRPILKASLATGSAPATAARSNRGVSSSRNQRRYRISWSTLTPTGVNRRAVQVSVVPFSSLTATLQSVQRRGGIILSVTNG